MVTKISIKYLHNIIDEVDIYLVNECTAKSKFTSNEYSNRKINMALSKNQITKSKNKPNLNSKIQTDQTNWLISC